MLLGVQVDARRARRGAPAREFAGHDVRDLAAGASFAGPCHRTGSTCSTGRPGTVTFAPALDLRPPDAPADGAPVALAAVPPAGREIRLWYRTGGGPSGNVAAGTLTTLRDPITGVTVTNPQPARGGRGHSRASKASCCAARTSSTPSCGRSPRATSSCWPRPARAPSPGPRAFTRASMWSFARRARSRWCSCRTSPTGPAGLAAAGRATLTDHQVDEAPAATQRDLDSRRTLGTSCRRDLGAVQGGVGRGAGRGARARRTRTPYAPRIHDRLHQTISPLPTPQSARRAGRSASRSARRTSTGCWSRPSPASATSTTCGSSCEEAPDARRPRRRARTVPAAHLVRRLRRGAVPLDERRRRVGAGRPVPGRGGPPGRSPAPAAVRARA